LGAGVKKITRRLLQATHKKERLSLEQQHIQSDLSLKALPIKGLALFFC
jgi:hypothetical protein